MLATEQDLQVEFLKCVANRAYFIDAHCQLKDEASKRWAPFHLWPAQRRVVADLDSGDHLVILKARQLGQTWILLAAILWQMLFRPAITVLLFSKRETEAWDLLKRLVGIFNHLPPWLQSTAGGVVTQSSALWVLGNGSEARAFPSNAGDSYTATIAFCDEFDLIDDQQRLLDAVEPTVGDSGQLILLSRSEKRRPQTPFKHRYQEAKAGLAGWRAIFLPWSARPSRDAAWYAARVAESLATDGTLDSVNAQYPATDVEALAPPSLDKRIPAAWLLQCYSEGQGRDVAGAPAVPDLVIYAPPDPGATYVLGADPAEGNPTSDDSAAVVVDRATGTEVAALVGKLQPEEFAGYCAQLARYYGGAPCLPERNNHGHAFLLAYRLAAPELAVLDGLDGRPGWLTTAPSKALLYDQATELFKAHDARVRSFATWMQLSSIEGSTLRAPKDEADDRAVAFVLAQTARVRSRDLRPAAVVTGPPRFGPGQYTPPGRGW